GARLVGDRMMVERHARRQHHSVEPCKIDLERVGDRRAALKRLARPRTAVPRGDFGAARPQRLHGRHAAARQPQHRVAFAAKGVRGNHRTFNVARPTIASMMAMIQNRITTVDSFHPSCSKWWWIGAMRKMRRPVRLNQNTWMIT